MKSAQKSASQTGLRGRGTGENPKNRFELLEVAPDPNDSWEDDSSVQTEFYADHSRSVIAYNDSPDVGFDASLNPYRGCEHGCIYCYARPSHEYLGFSAGLDFETKIMVKRDAPELLRRQLASKSWVPQVLNLSGVTDCYQPVERRLKITRRCLEVLLEFRNPVTIVTKNHLVTRDIDLLRPLAEIGAAAVFISVTTLSSDLARILEPRTSMPALRLEAIEALSKAGIPTGVMIAPVIPAINDSEIPAILKAAAKAGAQNAGYVMLRLPHGVKDLFQGWLERHFPDRKDKVLHRIQNLRGGKLNDPQFVSRMRGEGAFAQEVKDLFRISCRKAGIGSREIKFNTQAFIRPAPQTGQLDLFRNKSGL